MSKLDKSLKLNEEDLVQVTGGVYTGPCFKYTVGRMESLQSIAETYHTTVAVIAEINGIPVGQELVMDMNLLIPAK